MRKTRFIISTIISLLTLGAGLCSYDFYYDYDGSAGSEGQTDIGHIIKEDVIKKEDNSLNKLLKLFKLSDQTRYGDEAETSKAIYYAKMIVNLLLSLVSFIALIMLIYAFYMIFVSKEDTGITKAKQMLKGIVIAMAIMGLSRFIVSLIFWIQKGSAKQPNLGVNTFISQNIKLI